MRISDWSSDVCSSDLRGRGEAGRSRGDGKGRDPGAAGVPVGARPSAGDLPGDGEAARAPAGRCPAAGRAAGAETEDGTATQARKSVVQGKSGSVRVGLGGRRIIKKKIEKHNRYTQ